MVSKAAVKDENEMAKIMIDDFNQMTAQQKDEEAIDCDSPFEMKDWVKWVEACYSGDDEEQDKENR